MDHSGLSRKSKFRVPYINGKYLIGIGLVAACALVWMYGQATLREWREAEFVYLLEHKSLTVVFWLVWLLLAVLGYRYRFSLLPVVGILVNLYLMTELGASNWIIFLAWLVAGLAIYFAYGYRNSKLREGS